MARKKSRKPQVRENPEWEWADNIEDEKPAESEVVKHVAARCKGVTYRVGDIVQLQAETAHKWVGVIRSFETNYTTEDEDERMRVTVMWFHRQQDVVIKRRRKDAHAGEIYISNTEDSVTILSIRRHATVFPTQEEYWKHRDKAKTKNPDHDATYVCPMALNCKAGVFVEMNWKERYKRDKTDFDGIMKDITKESEKGRKRTRAQTRKQNDKKFQLREESDDDKSDDEDHGPKKRRRKDVVSTPKKKTVSTVSTPTGPRLKKALQITPLPMRTKDTSLFDSPYKLAQANLHVSAVPSSLPCREDEFNQILEYLEVAIDDGTGACIYVSGVPGTGKTATVREVVRALNERVDAEELDDFHFLEINGLKVLDPNQAYAMLWEALTGERVTPLHAASLLDNHFKKAGPGRVPCVVLLDELDQLVMAKQTVLYNLFNWPTLPNSRLIVIAIANTMNLADMLPNKIQSRVGLTRVNFEPYTRDQLIRIIESRLENVPGDIVEKDAIRLCAMRIANNTGDARKALDVCRRAVEVAEASAESNLPETPSKRRGASNPSDAGKVTAQLLNSVLQDFLRHPVQATLRYLPFTAKLFLAALLLKSRRSSGKSDITFGDVLEEATRICLSSVNNMEARVIMRGVSTPRGLEGAGVELEISNVIDWEERGGRRGGRVGLQISEDDLNMAFQQDEGWKEMMK